MNPLIGWSLAFVAFIVAWFAYGWPGVALAGSVVVFWLMLQFNRTLRVLRDAGSAPVGKVPSAVMFHAGLRKGLPMMKVVAMTKSLGRRVPNSPESPGIPDSPGSPDIWAWRDDSDAEVRIVFKNGRIESWVLDRSPPSTSTSTSMTTPAAATTGDTAETSPQGSANEAPEKAPEEAHTKAPAA